MMVLRDYAAIATQPAYGRRLEVSNAFPGLMETRQYPGKGE